MLVGRLSCLPPETPGARGRRTHSAGGMREDAVDHARAVEADHARRTRAHGRGLEPAHLLHAADIQLDLDRPGDQRISPPRDAPHHVGAQIGLGLRRGSP
jgi:hypothetical protein